MCRRLGIMLVLSSAGAAPLAAQSLTFDAYVGRATYDPVASAVGVRNAAVGVRYQDRAEWFYLTTAVPLGSGDPSWTAAGLSLRPRRQGEAWSFGVALTGHGYFYRDAVLDGFGAGAAVEALPFVGFRHRDLAFEVASGPSYATRVFADSLYTRSVHRTDVRLSAGGSVRFSAEGRYLRAVEASYPYVGLSGEVDRGRWRVWGGAGRWISDRLANGTAWRFGGALNLAAPIELWAMIRHEATDPVYWIVPRRSWDVGMSWSPGRRSVAVPALPPAVPAPGPATLRLPVNAVAGQPRVAGDFNNWTPEPMRRDGDAWVVQLDVERGIYHYAFVDSDGNWFVPEDFPTRKPDGMGGFVAVIVVP